MGITINGSSAAGTIDLGTNGTITDLAVGGVPDNTIDNGAMADDAIGVAELSATGTASSSTFLRGDNAWATPSGGAALTGSTNNTICTVTGADAIQGEASFTYSGTDVICSAGQHVLPGYSDSNNGVWFNSSGQFCTSATGNALFVGRNGSTGTLVMFRDDGSGIGQIETNGSNTTYNTSSDYRLKENKVNLTGGITRLKNLKPYRFNFKSTPSITQDGFYAHEVQEVVPIAATGTKDQVITQADLDSGQYHEGSVALNDVVPQCIDHSQLVPLLVAALQEAVVRIEALEAG